MTAPRTPRQTPGEELVACSILVTPATKRALAQLADYEQRSLSQIGRRALEAYVGGLEDLTNDHGGT